MATVKIVLRTNYQKKDGSRPLAIRITQNRKTRFVFTGKYIHPDHWDKTLCKVKRSYPNSKRLNLYLTKKLTEAEDIALEGQDNLSSQQISKKVKRSTSSTSFFQLGIERIKEKYDAGTFSVANSELSILYNIEEFLNLPKTGLKKDIIASIKQRRKERISKARKNGKNRAEDIKYFAKITRLSFEEIDIAFITKFKNFCTAYLGQETRTITNQLIFMRTLFNRAIKENIVNEKDYPFAGEKEKIRIGTSNKIGLNKDEIAKIENLELEENSSIWHTKNVFLVSYYFAGVRISDVVELKWSDIIDGRLYYEMNKNEKPVSLKVPQQALEILKLYQSTKSTPTDYIFPFLKTANLDDKEDIFTKARNATSLFNKYLKRIADLCAIEKKLSNHISRHSFGNIAGDKINPLMLQKLYRHSDLKTTLGYQANFIHKDADDALDQVLNS